MTFHFKLFFFYLAFSKYSPSVRFSNEANLRTSLMRFGTNRQQRNHLCRRGNSEKWFCILHCCCLWWLSSPPRGLQVPPGKLTSTVAEEQWRLHVRPAPSFDKSILLKQLVIRGDSRFNGAKASFLKRHHLWPVNISCRAAYPDLAPGVRCPCVRALIPKNPNAWKVEKWVQDAGSCS